MIVSFFNSHTDITPSKNKDVSYFLERIKNGDSREIIEKIRKEENKNVRQGLKKTLPAICFNGHFTKRAKIGLKKASGLMILDFDDVEDAEVKKNDLKQNKCILSAWISPSGGVKALLKINEVKSDEDFKNIFSSVSNDFEGIDESGKDISRLCYESYDPDIYINFEAETYIPTIIDYFDNSEIGEVTNIPIKDVNLIANKLLKWFEKKYNPSARNNSIFIFASALNDFGVDKPTALNYCQTFSQKGFGINEIKNVVDSAYKKTAQFGNKEFEDKVRKKKLVNYVLSGKKVSEIKKEFSDIAPEKIDNEIISIKESTDIEVYWEYDEYGEAKINSYKFKLYLNFNQYFKYFPTGSEKSFILIQKSDNFLDIVNEYKIKDYVINQLELKNEIDIYNVMVDSQKFFTIPYLSMINTAKVTFEKDTKDFAMLYYQNLAVKVFKDKIETINYADFDFYIWREQVIKRDFIEADHHKSQFRTFVWLISGQDRQRYNTVKSILGYLMHSHKTSANNKAIILNDEVISDTPNGGSGKGILTRAISLMKKLSTIDGKTFDFGKNFAYQTVSTDCQVLAFDDVKKNFDFEKLFSLITEGITIEYKGKDAVKLPIADSPKVLISTNYTIKADGGSFVRRIFEVELSSYFGSHHSPLDEFGQMLFDDWDEKEWQLFDKFMINCLQYYLTNGLVVYDHINLNIRKLINNTSNEFFEWMESKEFNHQERIFYNEWFDNFKSEFSDFQKWLTQRKFNDWLKFYFDFKGFKIISDSSNGKRFYQINKLNEPITTRIEQEEDNDGIFF